MSAAVVKLPTAAPRKVINSRFAAQRAANRAMRKEQGDRFTFLFPHQRERRKLADYIESHQLTGERRVLFAILNQMDAEAIERLKPAMGKDEDAQCLLKLARMDSGRAYWLRRELEDRGVL